LSTTQLRRIDKCKACGAPIMWAETSAAKAIPIDVSPTPRGNVVLYHGPGSGKLLALFGKKAQSGATELYESHFVTCPRAAEFRKPRKRSGAMRLP